MTGMMELPRQAYFLPATSPGSPGLGDYRFGSVSF